MSEPKKSIKLDNPIEFYQNNNIFKYGNSAPLSQNLQEKARGFDFTD